MTDQTMLKTELFGCEICARIIRLEEGIQVNISGGSRTHIGAVSFMGYNGINETIQLPGHKDAYISGHWAKTLWDCLREPVCVQCGIHYPDLSRSDIESVTASCDWMLETLLEKLS
ncbi:hypothetical protein [Anaerostipes sp.]|uniref:prenylated flavin chaperone LpdD n=1 Tax=Anaerostipes sp. TaxID=1872530 RepID=UPI0025C1B49D|nr:hypothetical protein [Anaerostipes sp.]MBS7008793.1 hypothetical protein [Anaerostipes sp.]